jgi:hypothetical protein
MNDEQDDSMEHLIEEDKKVSFMGHHIDKDQFDKLCGVVTEQQIKMNDPSYALPIRMMNLFFNAWYKLPKKEDNDVSKIINEKDEDE